MGMTLWAFLRRRDLTLTDWLNSVGATNYSSAVKHIRALGLDVMTAAEFQAALPVISEMTTLHVADDSDNLLPGESESVSVPTRRRKKEIV